jgi:hypothetical protein
MTDITPFQQILNFQEYFNNLLPDLTGKRVVPNYQINEKGEIIGIKLEYEDVKGVTPILNQDGANFALSALRTFMSPQLLIANLNRDTIATIAADITITTFTPLIIGANKYANVKNFEQYNSLMDAYAIRFFDALFLFLTALVGGGAREWVAKPYSVSIVGQQPTPEEAPKPSFFQTLKKEVKGNE